MAIKTGEKNARFLLNAAINITKTIKIKGFILLCIIPLQSPIEKNIIKQGITINDPVLRSTKREEKRTIKKFSKNKSI